MKVIKFGGSSLASVESITIAKNIVEADSGRSFVVVSAPGKCKEFPHKVTDLLIEAYAELQINETSESLGRVLERFRELSVGLGVDIEKEIQRTHDDIVVNQNNYDFVISRGEYLMAVLFSGVLGFKFVDAANYIVINKNGKYHEKATSAKFQRCVAKSDKIVMGGFYGSSVDGGVKCFTRGGSDYSGAICAVCLRADVYENFTDTYGVQTANPSLIKNTKSIHELDFGAMRRLSVAGASVIYPDCLPLLKRHAVPLKVHNTFDYLGGYTRIGCETVNSKYFCITYKFEQNINKDMVEVFCLFNKMTIGIGDLRKLLVGTEVYLVGFGKKDFTLISPGSNLSVVINMLHDYFIKF